MKMAEGYGVPKLYLWAAWLPKGLYRALYHIDLDPVSPLSGERKGIHNQKHTWLLPPAALSYKEMREKKVNKV